MKERETEAKIQELPEDLQQEALDYVDYLLSKYQKKKSKKEKFKKRESSRLGTTDSPYNHM